MIAIIASVLQTASFAALARPRQRLLCVSPQPTEPNYSSVDRRAALQQASDQQRAERLRFERATNKAVI